MDLNEHMSLALRKACEHALSMRWATEQQLREALEHGSGFARHLRLSNYIDKTQYEYLSAFDMIDSNIADYLIKDIIGAGSMGVVYLAQGAGGEAVAVKVIRDDFCNNTRLLERFKRESISVSSLQHQHILAGIDSGSYDGGLYLVSEYIDGPDLQQMFLHNGPLPEHYILQCMSQLVSGLKFIYNRLKLVHRDLKPSNILIMHGKDSCRDDFVPRADVDIVKIIDFGLVKSVNDTAHLTQSGIMVGTPYFMSPEQVNGSDDLDCRSDMYSVGVTMYKLLTGLFPYNGNAPQDVMLKHLQDSCPSPAELRPDLSEETVNIIQRCMQKDRNDRFRDYNALQLVLDAAWHVVKERDKRMPAVRHMSITERIKKAEQLLEDPDDSSMLSSVQILRPM